ILTPAACEGTTTLFEVHERDLWLDHPELHQVAARFRLLGAEGRPEAIDLAERLRTGLEIELAALCQVSLLVEIGRVGQRGGASARSRREDGRVEKYEAAGVEILAAGARDLAADAQHGVLAGRAQPQMAVVEQEGDPVFLRRDRILLGLVHDGEI